MSRVRAKLLKAGSLLVLLLGACASSETTELEAYVLRLKLFGGLFVVSVVALVVYLLSRHEAEKKEQGARLRAIALAYRKALDDLAANPTDPRARPACLERGRAFYATAIPDTFTLVFGTHVFGTQDYQNNTAGREARIAADMEACIGHLKLK